MSDAAPFSQMVVIGSSAGGIEALSTLVHTLPEGLPAPIVVAQHLDPSRESHLAEILSRSTAVPVRTLSDSDRLAPGVVYVVPANRDVEISDHDIRLLEGTHRSRPSIDHLFASAAQVFGENLIAIVLTGTGSDGAAGALDVQQAGGTVIIQDPSTASYPALPRSLAPSVVDFIVPLEDIGALLQELLTGSPSAASPDEDDALDQILRLLRDRHGIDFRAYKRPTVTRRIQRRMAATGSATIGDYLRFVQRHPEEQRVLIGTFLIKVTKFFRDADLFSTLRERILPEIIEAARARDHSIRLWSAGCATGEEAYSLAITLAECLGDEFDDFHVRIFATDLDADAVAFARQGLYAPSALSGVDAGTIQRHFDMADGGFQIAKRIRGLLVFGQHDLADRAPFPRVDLVLCRNVLIYFTTELQRSILQLFAFSLRDGGYLILGKSETTTPYADAFAPDDGRLKIYRRRGDRAALPVAPIREMIPPSTPRVIPSRPALHSHTLSTPARTAAEQTQIRRADSILFDLPIGVVVVDRRYDIQYINDAARLLLGVHSSALGEDLIHLVHTVPAAELRALIDQAVSSGGQCSGTLTAVPVGPDAPSHLHVICTADTSDQSAPVTTVCISDGTERVEERVRLESDLARATEARERAEQQGQHLVDTNREFLAANQQLTREMAELRRQNEEFLVGNEELQAAAEEVETLNEELQATNEELETLNEELQATVEELNTTNDDLQTRNLEIQELAISVEAARARLNAVLNSLGDAIVLVDSQGRTILTNGLYDELFPTPFELLEVRALDGSTLSEDQLPNRRAGRGEAFQMSASMPDADGNARALSVSAQPLHGEGSEGSDGGVLVIRRLGDAGDQG